MQTTQREIDDLTAHWSYAELWDKFPIPARPDTEECAMEEEYIRSTGKSPAELAVMILGSTIEYRSLCKKLGIPPYVVDFSKENFDSLTAYSLEKFEKEHFIESDWLEVAHENFFDVILGHRPFNVIRHDQVGKLFSVMYNALKPGGVFFCRGNVKFPDYVDTLDQIITKWGLVKERPHPMFSYIEVALYMHCSDDQGYLDYPKCRTVMKEYFDAGKIIESDYRLIQPLISMAEGTKFRAFIPKEELETNMSVAGFTYVEWLWTPHEFTKNMPIIKLTK